MQRERLTVSVTKIADLVARGGDSDQIATLAVTTWQAIHDDLAPVIGPRGVSALFQRSLHIAAVDLPWLKAAHAAALHPREFDALGEALSRQPAAIGAAANDALLNFFWELMTGLIGESLAGRLLRSAGWNKTAGGPAVEEARS